jgi:hypothetical protein
VVARETQVALAQTEPQDYLAPLAILVGLQGCQVIQETLVILVV